MNKYLVIIFITSTCFGQVFGPTLNPNKFQIGFTHKQFYRILEREYDSKREEKDWATNAFYVKYGISKYFTLGLEGFLYDNSNTDDVYSGSNHRVYSFGADLITQLYKYKNFGLLASVHYNEYLFNDKSPLRYDIITMNRSFLLQGRLSTLIKKQKLGVFIAPGYFYDDVFYYTNSSYNIVQKCRSINNFGTVIGADFQLFNHLGCFSHFIYLENVQPRLGINYQF